MAVAGTNRARHLARPAPHLGQPALQNGTPLAVLKTPGGWHSPVTPVFWRPKTNRISSHRPIAALFFDAQYGWVPSHIPSKRKPATRAGFC